MRPDGLDFVLCLYQPGQSCSFHLLSVSVVLKGKPNSALLPFSVWTLQLLFDLLTMAIGRRKGFTPEIVVGLRL